MMPKHTALMGGKNLKSAVKLTQPHQESEILMPEITHKKILAISAANVLPSRSSSASTKACGILKSLLEAQAPGVYDVEVLPLIDYDLKPCCMCGACFGSGKCALDEDFNRIYQKLSTADGLLLVCPHYAPIPSKAIILFEKLEEIFYLNYCTDETYRPPYAGKPVGIVAHGGQTNEALPLYQQALVKPLADVVEALGMKVVNVNEEKGVAFGITKLFKPDDSIFVTIEHDWEAIKTQLQPLVVQFDACLRG